MARKPKYAMQKLFTENGQISEMPVLDKSSTKELLEIIRKGVKKMARLSDYGTINRNQRAERLDDIADKEVTIVDFRLVNGQFGEYAFMDVVDEEENLHIVMTGAVYVLDALKDARDKQALPLQAKFKRSGRAWIFE